MLTSEDDRPDAEPAAVISHEWWQSQFNGDQSVLGTTLYLNYRPHTIVGVASPEFVQEAAAAAWSDDDHAAQRREIFSATWTVFLESDPTAR